MKSVKVYNDWVVVLPVEETKEGFIIPVDGSVGKVTSVGQHCSEDVKSLCGKTIYYGKEADRLKVDGNIVYVMKPSNLYFSLE